MKILMVCLGNICRSPMADGLLRQKIARRGLKIDVDSAGTSDYHVGEAPDKRMQLTAQKFGTEIGFLRARQFEVSDFDAFDLIYAMDDSNFNSIMDLARNDQDRLKVHLILNELNPGKNEQVPDPYFGGEEGFEEVYFLLDRATDAILTKLNHG